MSSTTGSVYQRKSDGRWVASIKLGGRKIVRYGATEREARQRLRELIGQQERGTLTLPTKVTLGQWADRWLTMIEADRRPATIATYRYALAPAISVLGDQRLDRLSPVVLAQAFTALRQEGKGSRRLSQTYRVLHTCLGQAERLEIIGSNPLRKVDPPRHTQKPVKCWTLEETQRFIAACVSSGASYGPMFLFMLGTGLRRGECTALTWGDIDLINRVVVVDKAVSFVKNRPLLQPTKTAAGTRAISLTALAASALGMLPRSLDREARVFTSGAGTEPTPSNARSGLHRLCDQAGIPRVPPHALRHTHVSLLLAAGVDVLTVSRRVGHARTSMTVDIYGHVLRPDGAAAAAFDNALVDKRMEQAQ
jgi:integrase